MKILSALLIYGIAFTSPALASDDYQPPYNGSPSGTVGSGTRFFDCTYRGSDRKEGCV
jgi:hypothetical protein